MPIPLAKRTLLQCSVLDVPKVGLSDVISSKLSLLTKGAGQQEEETEGVSGDCLPYRQCS